MPSISGLRPHRLGGGLPDRPGGVPPITDRDGAAYLPAGYPSFSTSLPPTGTTHQAGSTPAMAYLLRSSDTMPGGGTGNGTRLPDGPIRYDEVGREGAMARPPGEKEAALGTFAEKNGRPMRGAAEGRPACDAAYYKVA